MKTYNRPLEHRERAELEAIVSWSAAVRRATIFAVLVFATAFAFRVVNRLSPSIRWWPIGTAVVSAAVFVYAKRLTGGAALRSAVREDLHGDVAEVHEYDLQCVAVFPEVEDEGPVWLFPDEGRTVRVSGQKLVHATKGELPKKRLRITSTPHAHRILDFLCEGESPEVFISPVPFAQCSLFVGKKLVRFYEPMDVSWPEVVSFVTSRHRSAPRGENS